MQMEKEKFLSCPFRAQEVFNFWVKLPPTAGLDTAKQKKNVGQPRTTPSTASMPNFFLVS